MATTLLSSVIVASPTDVETRRANASNPEDWDLHWSRLKKSAFGRACSSYRRWLRSRCVAEYLDPLFSTSGVFVECGCGSGESSVRLPRRSRHRIGVDFSDVALSLARSSGAYEELIRADIRELPFAESTLDGVWNLGVMEHFTQIEQESVLSELRRVVKPGGVGVFWWPRAGSWDDRLQQVLGRLFPPEPGRASESEITQVAAAAGWIVEDLQLPLRDLHTEWVAVLRK